MTGGSSCRPRRRRADETGGVWIITGFVLGAIVYAGMVLMAVAGFTAVVPLVVIPPVLVGIIAANSLLGGGRGPSRSAPSGDLPGPAAPSPGGSAGPSGTNGAGGRRRPPAAGAAPTNGEPRGPR
jgi:hypothetical protein